MSQKIQKIILIIIIIIIRNQKSTLSTHYFLLNIYIIFIKRFINLAINFFNISNKNVERNFRKKFRENFRKKFRKNYLKKF